MNTPDAIVTLQNAFWRQVECMLYHHTNPWELDEALCAWGCTMGPCEAQDLLGLEQVLQRGATWPGPILPRMLAEGRMGKIGGVGFYRYPGGGGAVIDPLIEDLILEEAWFGKVTRTDITDQALVARMLGALEAPCRVLRKAGCSPADISKHLTKALHFPLNTTLPVAT